MNVQAVSHRPARFGLALSPGVLTLAGIGYKGSSAAFRVEDVGENKELRKAAIKQNSILVSLMGSAQYVLEHLKRPLSRLVDNIPAGRLSTVVKASVLAGPMLIANVFSEWASRKLSNYNHAMDAALQGKSSSSKQAVAASSSGRFWAKRNRTEATAAFEARLHTAPWTVSPHRQEMGIVPRY